MENQTPANTKTVLAVNGGPLLREAILRFRQACLRNPYTRWLQPKQQLSKAAQTLSLPLSWTVTLPRRGSFQITPDTIVGFKVMGSIDRLLLLSVDDGCLPIHAANGDSIFLRTQALVTARESGDMRELRTGRKIVVWIMQDLERLEKLRRLCARQGHSWVCFIDKETFFSSDDVLAINWQMPDRAPHSLI